MIYILTYTGYAPDCLVTYEYSKHITLGICDVANDRPGYVTHDEVSLKFSPPNKNTNKYCAWACINYDELINVYLGSDGLICICFGGI